MPGMEIEPYNPFSNEIMDLFHASSYTMVNLEAPLTDRGKAILKTGKNFRISPQYAEILKNAGVDCVCLANNHIRDYGAEGVMDTIKHCQEAGLDVVGAGRDLSEAAKPLVKKLGNQKVAFLNYCEREFSIAGNLRAGANPFDPIDAYHDIRVLRSEVDKIVVVYHGGFEYQHYPTPAMLIDFRFLIETGGDAVAAHHAHAYSGFEFYLKKPIYYGLGNLLSLTLARSIKDNWFSGLLACINIDSERIDSQIIPVSIGRDMNSVDISIQDESSRISQHLSQLSDHIRSDGFTDYWENWYRDNGDRILNDFVSSSKLAKKLKRILRLKKKNLGRYRTLTWLNHVRCITHREKLISILENKYNSFRKEN